MIISHRHRFIFIKNLKTAGTSIEAYLSPHCGEEDILTPVVPPEVGHEPRNFRGFFNPVEQLFAPETAQPGFPSRPGILWQFASGRRFFNHMPAVSVRARISRQIWDGYLKFCVERNPFEKTVSFYRMLKKQGIVTSVDDLIRQNRLPSDWQRYSDLSGQPIVDRVLRFENLDRELDDLFSELGIPFSGQLAIRAKVTPKGDRSDYRSILQSNHRAEIERRFSKEISQFGYSWA